MPDGSHILLKKLAADYDPTNALRAVTVLHEARHELKLVTGLLYVNPASKPFSEELELCEEPLASLAQDAIRPGRHVLDEIMKGYLEGTIAAAAGGG